MPNKPKICFTVFTGAATAAAVFVACASPLSIFAFSLHARVLAICGVLHPFCCVAAPDWPLATCFVPAWPLPVVSVLGAPGAALPPPWRSVVDSVFLLLLATTGFPLPALREMLHLRPRRLDWPGFPSPAMRSLRPATIRQRLNSFEPRRFHCLKADGDQGRFRVDSRHLIRRRRIRRS